MRICWVMFLRGEAVPGLVPTAGDSPPRVALSSSPGVAGQVGGMGLRVRAECRVGSAESLGQSPLPQRGRTGQVGMGPCRGCGDTRCRWQGINAEYCGTSSWGTPLALPSLLAGRAGGGRGWYPAVGQLGLGRMEEGADTHVTVVLSNCSARLSMADDCKYGGSLSVCLSVRCVSVLASPVFVLCGCPRPAHTLLWLPTWSTSVVPILVLPAWHWLLAGTCPWPQLGSGGWKGPGRIGGAWMRGDARVSRGVGGDGDGAVPCNQGQPNPG